MSRFLFTSDIHLSPRPRDAYRWDIFRWLGVQANNRNVDAAFILGDLTDQKDNHTNRFINQVIDSIRTLTRATEARVILISGNHDYSDPKAPLLRFLDDYYITPTVLKDFDERIMLLPNTRTPKRDWRDLKLDKYDLALCHQTFASSKAESGIPLQGLTIHSVPSKRVISGDVHVPQKVAHIRYCGAPHPIHFGDNFEPRVLYWEDGSLKSIPRTTIRKLLIETDSLEWLANESNISEGDQVKVRLRLPRSRFGEWEELRKEVQEIAEVRAWELCGLELEDINREQQRPLRGSSPASSSRALDSVSLLRRFGKLNEISNELLQVGLGFLT